VVFKLFSGLLDSNEREIKRLRPIVDKINDLEPDFAKLTDAELRAKTDEFKKRIIEATTEKRSEVEEACKELAERQKTEAELDTPIQKEDFVRDIRDIKTRLKQRNEELRAAEKKALDDILPEAFAAVREAAKRTLHQRHFDEQLMGGIVLHQGKIAEMRTGEGKTLVATLPLYLNSLTGRGCHLITVNDYLAKRDPYWMAPIFNALGVSIASIQHETAYLYDASYESTDKRWKHFKAISRKEAYGADITYGTNNEFGFDYLRDNMVIDLSQCVQRSFNYAIVDEVDNILIDEARTPLIISGAAEDTSALHINALRAIHGLKKQLTQQEFEELKAKRGQAEAEKIRDREFDYVVDEKARNIWLTTRGEKIIADAFQDSQLYGGDAEETIDINTQTKRNLIKHYVDAAIKAQVLYRRDRDYVIHQTKEAKPEVVIVDEFTGRLMFGRRYSEGLHEAIEAKENVRVKPKSRTMATITFQNYFRLYPKLSGMTGTAETEAEEFSRIYSLEVVVIPTHLPMIREDNADQIYGTEEGKYRAVVREIKQLHDKGQPVLVGTVSIERSEQLGKLLKREGVEHHILNAKNHEQEANIIAQAGRISAVTVATNMAGRGVDIILGGNPEGREKEEWQKEHDHVVSLGGLHVIGTERHESRRIDNQLRGRSGRQGDPGSSRFFVSLEDDIMRRFGGERIKRLMKWAGVEEDVPIEHAIVSRAIENTQKQVEGYHFDIRKHLVEYDDVVNKHREVIYAERKKILSGADLKSNILNMIGDEIHKLVDTYLPDDESKDMSYDELRREVSTIYSLPADVTAEFLSRMSRGEVEKYLLQQVEKLYKDKEKETGPEDMKILERLVMLRVIDNLWIDHLTTMEDMRQGIGLQAIGRGDPLIVYKREGHEMFQSLLDNIRHDVVHTIFHVNIVRKEENVSPMASARVNSQSGDHVPTRVTAKKVGRNDPCPCGSGKKYKHCCGRNN